LKNFGTAPKLFPFSRKTRLYTTGGCSTGIGQEGMEKNHWLQRFTWAMSSQEHKKKY